MAGRVSLGGQEMNLQDAISVLEEQLAAARVAASLPIADQLNATIRGQMEQTSNRPNYDLVSSITVFDGEKPESVNRFFQSLDDIGELSNWTEESKLRVAKLKLAGAALKYVTAEDQNRLATYAEFKRALTDRFSNKAPLQLYFQQLAVIQQRHGEAIEAFADRVKAVNEKTVRVTNNAEVNAALREEADRRALDAFQRGLVGKVGEQTRLKFPTTLTEAITTAIAIEYLEKSDSSGRNEKKVFQADVVCFKCHKKGHVSRDCRSQGSGNADHARDACWRCGRTGHKRRDCHVTGVRREDIRNQSGNGRGVSGNADTQPRM